MNLKNFCLAGALAAALLCANPKLPAQINIAAIAQYKYNQQHALAQSLSKQDGPAPHKHRKGKPAADAAAGPAVIPAHNPTFKSIYGDTHRKNVR